MPDDTDIRPPDFDNPPCPACYSFDASTSHMPATPEEHAEDLRKAYAAGMAAGFLMCRTHSKTWEHLCPTHRESCQAVIDAVCADLGLPREKVYADFGIPMPEKEPN